MTRKPVALRRGKDATCFCFPVVLTQSTLNGHSVPCTDGKSRPTGFEPPTLAEPTGGKTRKPVALRRGKAATCSCFPVVLTQSTLQGHSVPCTTGSYSPATSLPNRQHGQPLQNSPAGQSALLHTQQLPRFRPDYTPPPSVCTACTLCRDATVTCLFFGSHWHPDGILGHVQLYAQHGQSPVNQEN